MEEYRDEEIERLIRCPKRVNGNPIRALRLVGADQRNDFHLSASNAGDGDFSMFIRVNEDFPENFSIGLTRLPSEGWREIVLLRCNGKHGIFNGTMGSASHPHFAFHIHKASELAIAAGQRPEKYADATTEYASYEEALQYFVRRVNIDTSDIHKYFPKGPQNNLDFQDGE